MANNDFPLVSALFITYSRLDLLTRAITAFRENTDYPNLEIVIADDGSPAEIQKKIHQLPADIFALSTRNQGLGANNNNGLRQCSGKYILMVQDDWLCCGPSDYLINAIKVLEKNPDIGIINFAGAPHPPDKTQPLFGSSVPCFKTPQPYQESPHEQFLYSDQPHIQTRAALEHVGLYKEDRNMEQCEIDYNFRWKKQQLFGTAVFPGYYMKVFSDEGGPKGRSYRLTTFRSRVDLLLLPAARFLKENCRPLYRVGKASIRTSVALMEKIGIVR